MQTITATVRAAIKDCDKWYATRSRNIRTLTEPINALWIEIEYHTRRMEWAEARGMEDSVALHCRHILDYLERIQVQAQEARN